MIYELNDQLEFKGTFMKRNSEKCVFIYVEENRLYILSKMGHLDIIECLEGEKVYKRMLKKAKSKAKKV